MKKDMRYLCYPFMRESAATVDFEIRTDSLTTRIGEALSLTKEVDAVQWDLQIFQPVAYHLKGSVRGKLAINEKVLNQSSSMYDYYVNFATGKTGNFVLPHWNAMYRKFSLIMQIYWRTCRLGWLSILISIWA